MVFSTSSAEPGVLNQYGRVMLTIDTELYGQASALTLSLHAFESRCRERQFRLPVNQIPEDLMSHVRRAEQHEQWVFSVAKAFANADGGLGGVPTTAAELYEWLENPPTKGTIKTNHPDITIVRIGADEYLILVQGTRGGPDDPMAWVGAANTWPNNFYSGLGNESDYSEQLRSAIEEAGLPTGSKLHFAGHSQGGHAALIVANEIADGDRYQIASYTGFGTYYSQESNPKIPIQNIYNYDNDPVGLGGQHLDAWSEFQVRDATVAASFFGIPLTVLGYVGINTAKVSSGNYRDPKVTYIGEYTQQNLGESQDIGDRLENVALHTLFPTAMLVSDAYKAGSTQLFDSMASHNAYDESAYLTTIPVAWGSSDTFEVVDTHVSTPGPRQQGFEDTVEKVGVAAEKCRDSAFQVKDKVSNTVNQTVDYVQDGWEATTDAAEVVGDAVADTIIDWFDT